MCKQTPGDLVKLKTLIQEVWGGAQDSAGVFLFNPTFLTSSRALLVPLLLRRTWNSECPMSPAPAPQHHWPEGFKRDRRCFMRKPTPMLFFLFLFSWLNKTVFFF